MLQLEQLQNEEFENLPPSNVSENKLGVLKLNLQRIAELEAEVQRLRKVCFFVF